MNYLNLPVHLEDKTYQIKFTPKDKTVSKIISYFPLSEDDKQIFINLMQKNLSTFDGFYSIFSDKISEQEWTKSQAQIKKRFQDELIEID